MCLKPFCEKHRRRKIHSFAPLMFKREEQGWCARRGVVHAELFDRHCSPPSPMVCVPEAKLLPDDTYEPLMAKNLSFLIFDFFLLSHFPGQDGTLQQFFCNFPSLSSPRALSLLVRGMKGFLVLCYVSLKGILYLRVQN